LAGPVHPPITMAIAERAARKAPCVLQPDTPPSPLPSFRLSALQAWLLPRVGAHRQGAGEVRAVLVRRPIVFSAPSTPVWRAGFGYPCSRSGVAPSSPCSASACSRRHVGSGEGANKHSGSDRLPPGRPLPLVALNGRNGAKSVGISGTAPFDRSGTPPSAIREGAGGQPLAPARPEKCDPSRRPRLRPDAGPRLLPDADCLGTESEVLSEAQRAGWSRRCRAGNSLRCLGSGTRRLLRAFDRFLEICKASGISSAGAARQFVVSGIAAAHSACGDALNFPARPRFAPQRVSRKRP
jgi:hypothetical protein